jgi:hypothetical protein
MPFALSDGTPLGILASPLRKINIEIRLTKILSGVIRWTVKKVLLITISLLLLMTVNIAGCGNKGLTAEQRQTYINMAVDYENKAVQAQQLSDEAWKAALASTSTSGRQLLEALAKEKQDLASEYRGQALKYRESAAK